MYFARYVVLKITKVLFNHCLLFIEHHYRLIKILDQQITEFINGVVDEQLSIIQYCLELLWNLVETSLGSLSTQEEPHAAHRGDDEEENKDDGQHHHLEPALLATSLVPLVATAAAEAE